MQLKMKIIHTPGMFSLIDVDGVCYMPKHPIQTSFYDRDKDGDKDRAEHELFIYARGISDGWNVARNALGTSYCDNRVEEFEGYTCGGKTFYSLDEAKAYAERLFKKRGTVSAIEKII